MRPHLGPAMSKSRSHAQSTQSTATRSNGHANAGKRRQESAAMQFAKLAFAITVIYTAYLIQGQVQEQLAKSKYGFRGATFDRMEALIGFQCIVCFVWAGLLELAVRHVHWRKDTQDEQGRPKPIRYAFMGLTNVIGPACGVYALKKISYPAQTLAKSCKSVPIMLTGALLYNKRYSMAEYASVAAVGVGIGMFALASKPGKATMGDTDPVLGYALVAANLLLDSLTNTGQDQIKKQYPKVTGMHMMCWINFWGGLYYSIAFFAATSTGTEVVQFCLQHREAMWHLLSFCMCGAIGQLGIFYAVAQFGTLVTSLVCTTRKGFSILLSVLRSGTMLSAQQSMAVGLVFAGLLGKQFAPRKQGGGGSKNGKTT